VGAVDEGLVSVIVPTHNRGLLLEEAIRSVLAQTYPHREIIVVDDGSTDDTRSRVQKYVPSVRYIYQPNQGAAAARNTGIAHGRGEYVAFLDDDDLWLPRKLELQAKLLVENPRVGLVYTWRFLTDLEGRVLPQIQRPMHRGNVLGELLLACFVVPSVVMVRREWLDRIGLFDTGLRTGEDWDLWLRLAIAGCRFEVVPEVLVMSRLHAGHLSGDPAALAADGLRVLAKAQAHLPAGSPGDLLARRGRTCFLARQSASLIGSGRQGQGIRLLSQAVELSPEVLDRPGFFLSLARDLMPVGYRADEEVLSRVDDVARALMEVAVRLFGLPNLPEPVRSRRRRAWSNLMAALAFLYARAGRWRLAVMMMSKAMAEHPLAPPLAVLQWGFRRLGDIVAHARDGLAGAGVRYEEASGSRA
jgi:GT2 family glycosyltransferase